MKGVKVDEEKLEAVSEFCYLSAGGGCELTSSSMVRHTSRLRSLGCVERNIG